MWTSDSMTFLQSFNTFLIGFSIVFICLVSLSIFIILSSKIIGLITRDNKDSQEEKVEKSTSKVDAKESQEEMENLAVIISAISEEMRQPVDSFKVVSIKEL